LHLGDVRNQKLSGFLGKSHKIRPGSKERASQPGAGAKRGSKWQSLNAEEEEGLLSPLTVEGFSRQTEPCV